MKQLEIEINGTKVASQAEPRTHLADFLREQQFLTGTHVGCEHGVCGACTLLIDGVPARSCITYAVACDGAQVTTIEGLRDDPVIADLREAFSANHALQCGFCTPAMLISCRDILTRLPDADEKRIRLELSGNLCRCTGYVGIVAAVIAVQKKRRVAGTPAIVFRNLLGPVGAHAAAGERAPDKPDMSTRATAAARPPMAPAGERVTAEQWQAVETSGVELVETFRVPYPRAQVWDFFADLGQVARCMPGAGLTQPPNDDGRAEGEVRIKLGPIVSVFAGVVEVTRDAAQCSGLARATGRDAKSGSNARALISYRLQAPDATTTQVDISVKFILTGALAQFGRAGLIKNVADHLTQLFATNLEASLSGKQVENGSGATLDATAIARAAIWDRIRGFFTRKK